MSRLRQAWHAFWYLSRWTHLARMLFILGCGLFLLGGGFLLLMQPALSDRPERLVLTQVTALLAKPSPRYVSFEAELDLTKKIYYTGSVPYWGNCPPDQVHALPASDAPMSEFMKLLGCRVTVTGRLIPSGVQRITNVRGAGEQGAQAETRVLAAVDGAARNIRVQSEAFKQGDTRETEWLSRTVFTGVLATYEQMHIPRTGSAQADPLFFVILDGSDAFLDEKARQHFSSRYWVPIKGTENSLFLWVTPGVEASFNGFVTGVLEPRDRSDYKTRNKGYAHFSVVTGRPLPDRYGVIRYATTKEYNDAEVGIGWPFMLFGSLIAGAGITGLLFYIAAPGIIYDAWKRAIESVRRQGSGGHR